jgi:stalled ribosome alternative rescue factor ArfA
LWGREKIEKGKKGLGKKKRQKKIQKKEAFLLRTVRREIVKLEQKY